MRTRMRMQRLWLVVAVGFLHLTDRDPTRGTSPKAEMAARAHSGREVQRVRADLLLQARRERTRQDSHLEPWLRVNPNSASGPENYNSRRPVHWRRSVRATSAQLQKHPALRERARARNICTLSHGSRYRLGRRGTMRRVMVTHDSPRPPLHGNGNPVEAALRTGTPRTIREDQSPWQDPDQELCTAHRTCQARIGIDQQAVRTSTTINPAACPKVLACEARDNPQFPMCQPATNSTLT